MLPAPAEHLLDVPVRLGQSQGSSKVRLASSSISSPAGQDPAAARCSPAGRLLLASAQANPGE
ncbi:hypothetical protein G3I60_19420 [Streptomyces sp. SID13666]|uniref:hypothetical protein n=1 Tax=Streptomyces TaxID=1883 RepID=UPI0013C1A985|nr:MULTISPECIES: hypothetical protein [Streptomyces]MCZ4102933.1 hypothetical protein [Streptomyces sp. H39-C1]NEA56256.1 hypothetical protein [Streptomyces sp. SID13666]NEA71927.1 hypothetical protein [Streptomyces sp. SID13588]